jgi:hypothetical protein
MDKDHYNIYYSYDEMLEDVYKLPKIEINKFVTYSNPLCVQKLFDFAVDNNVVELAEYLYIFNSAIMSLNKLYGHDNIVNSLNEQSCGGNLVAGPLESSSGGSSGIKLQYFDKKNKKRTDMINRLTNLRKYSKMKSKNKDFYYTFCKKYTNRLFT